MFKEAFTRNQGWHIWSSDYQVPTDILIWCLNQFGPPEHSGWGRWAPTEMMQGIRFRDEKDYILFALTWM